MDYSESYNNECPCGNVALGGHKLCDDCLKERDELRAEWGAKYEMKGE